MGAGDFRALAGVLANFSDGVRQGVVKAGPSAAGIEFVFRPEQGFPAFAADIGALFEKADESSGKGRFRSLMLNDALFRFSQRMPPAGGTGIRHALGGGNSSFHGHDARHAFRDRRHP